MSTYGSLHVSLGETKDILLDKERKNPSQAKNNQALDPIYHHYFKLLSDAVGTANLREVHRILKSAINPSKLANMTEEKSGETLLLKVCKQYINAKDELEKNQLLQIAVLLIQSGLDVNKCNKDGMNPLLFACQQLKPKLVHFLFKNGAHLNLEEINKYLPMYEEKSTNSQTKKTYPIEQLNTVLVIAKLIQQHTFFDFSIPDFRFWWYWTQDCLFTGSVNSTPITREFDLYSKTELSVLETIAEYDLNLANNKQIGLLLEEKPNRGLLEKAIESANLEAARQIISKLANPEMKGLLIFLCKIYVRATNDSSKTELQKYFIEKNLFAIAGLLIANHQDVNEEDKTEYPLQIAVKNIKPRLVCFLLDRKAKFDAGKINALLPLFKSNAEMHDGLERIFYPQIQLRDLLIIIRLLANQAPEILHSNTITLQKWIKFAESCCLTKNENGIDLCISVNLLQHAMQSAISDLIKRCHEHLKFPRAEINAPSKDYQLKIELLKVNQIRNINKQIDTIIRSIASLYKLYNHFFNSEAAPKNPETSYQTLVFGFFTPFMVLMGTLFLKNILIEKHLQTRLQPFRPEEKPDPKPTAQNELLKVKTGSILVKWAKTPIKLALVFCLYNVSRTTGSASIDATSFFKNSLLLLSFLQVNRYLEKRFTTRLKTLETEQKQQIEAIITKLQNGYTPR